MEYFEAEFDFWHHLIVDFSTKIIMEKIVKNPGLQLLIQNILSCLQHLNLHRLY